MRHLPTAYISWLLLACLVGCATPDPGRPSEDPEVKEALKKRSPLPYWVFVAPPQVSEVDSETIPLAHPIPVADTRIREVVLEAVDRNGIFARTLASDEGTPRSPKRMLVRARESGAHLLLEFTLKRIDCTYVGRNSLWLPNLFLWLTLWVPSLWVADQTYQLEVEADYDLRNTQDGSLVYEGSITSTTTVDLDYIDRDVAWLGLFRLEEGELNWEAIIDRVRPQVLYQLERTFLLSLLREFDPVARGTGFPQQVFPGQSSAREIAVVIGISDYDHPALQNLCQYGVADAISYLDFLGEREEVALKEDGVELLVGAGATKEKISDAFFKFGLSGTQDRRQHREKIFVYFSGVGARVRRPDGGGYEYYLLPHDADPEDLAGTAISLAQLAEWLGPARADEVLLVVDAGFGSTGSGKGIGTAGRAEEEERSAFLAAVRKIAPGDGRGVIFAGMPGDEVSELRGDGHAYLTFYLLRWLEARGDLDSDGAVTLGEIMQTVPGRVKRETGLIHREQTPVIFGDEKLVLSRP